jgi:hypothetical protein
MAKKKTLADPIVLETLGQAMVKPLEFTVEERGDALYLLLSRDNGDGTFVGKVKLLRKEGLTLRKFSRTYEQMLADFKADNGGQL